MYCVHLILCAESNEVFRLINSFKPITLTVILKYFKFQRGSVCVCVGVCVCGGGGGGTQGEIEKEMSGGGRDQP